MDFISLLESMNEFLNQSYFFRAFKFFLGFYLIVLTLVIIIIISKFWSDYKKSLLAGAGYKPELGKFQLKWNSVVSHVESDDPKKWSIAILEFTQMLNEVLKAVGYEGDSLGERLNNILPSQLDNIDKLKEINEIKNKIVKDPTFVVTQDDAVKARDYIGRALDTFEMIEIDE